MSCGVENYDQFCSDKKSALASFIKEFDPHFEELLQNFGYAGIHTWAAGALSAARQNRPRVKACVKSNRTPSNI